MKAPISIPLFLASLACGTFAQASTISIAQSSGETLNVTVSAVGSDAWAKADQTRSADLPDGAAWQDGSSIYQLPRDFPIDPGNAQNPLDPCRNACSPFYGGVYGTVTSDGATDWETTPFWTVFAPTDGDNNVPNQATLGFAAPVFSMSLLWGSADDSNRLEFLLGDAVVGSFWGSEFAGFKDLAIVQDPGQSAAHVSFAGLEFDAVRFSAYTDGGSFEFSNVVVPAPVPLPAGAVLLLTGLAAVAAAGRARAARG